MKIQNFLGLTLAALLGLQISAWAENAQGTISSIDYSGHTLEIIPPHEPTAEVTTVLVTTAPGVDYKNAASFDDLKTGDFIKIKSSSKSRSGSSVEAVEIEKIPAAEIALYVQAPLVTGYTQTQTTTTTVAAVAGVPVEASQVTTTGPVVETQVVSPVPVVVQNQAPTLTKKVEKFKDGDSVTTRTTTTASY